MRLSDGTEVSLNYGSSLKYPQHFSGDIWALSLRGEAYFDVASDSRIPFVVNTGRLHIKALGTIFNVSAYPEDDIVETALLEGRVVLEETKPGEKNEPIGAMVPGQCLSYHLKSLKVTSCRGNVDKCIAWKEGKLVFDNEPITVVAERLSRKFYVDIEVAEEIQDYCYTATFTDDPLLLILDLMSAVTDISYETLPRRKLSDGRFSKNNFYYDRVTKHNKAYGSGLTLLGHEARIAPYHVLWPIPSDVILANTLGVINQNEGYVGADKNIAPLETVQTVADN